MTRTKLWQWYFNLFIRTPIAALLLIIALIAGLTLLTGSITVRQYETVQIRPAWTDEEMVGASFEAKLDQAPEAAGVQVGDAVVWYFYGVGERYDGEVTSIERSSEGSSVHIRAAIEDWEQGMKAYGSDAIQLLADLPVAKVTVKEKIFGAQRGGAQ
jgi:hypothetical protein